MPRPPTLMQLQRLAILGNPRVAVIAGRKREWRPLMQRGLVEVAGPWNSEKFMPPLRITPEGLRVLAENVSEIRAAQEGNTE